MTKRPGVSTLTDRLLELHEAGVLVYRGHSGRGGDLLVEVDAARSRAYQPLAMMSWLDGFTAGRSGDRFLATVSDTVPIRRVLVNPHPRDQFVIHARVAMQRQHIGVVELAQRVGVTRKPVSAALRFGEGRYRDLRLRIWDALGLPYQIGGPPKISSGYPLALKPPAGWVEPERLARLRWLGFADDHGLIRWIRPLDPDTAMFARAFVVQVGAAEVTVRGDSIRPWLTGVADAVAPDLSDEMYQLSVSESP